MKFLVKIFILLTFLCSVNMGSSYAFQNVVSDSSIAERATLSYLMYGTDGTAYNLYIVGEGEKFAGSSAAWKRTPDDRIYMAKSYDVYISGTGDSIPKYQPVKLFGDTKGRSEYMNLTDPTYTSGCYLIKGKNSQPDILVSALQMTGGGFVDYRFFVIKDGIFKQMQLMSDNQQTRLVTIGTHKRPYELDDGTVAIPWFRQRTIEPGGGNFGNYISVYMPDYTNLILIHGYTFHE